MKKKPAVSDLSPAQREIMEVVWDRGEVSVSDVYDVMSPDRDIVRNTIRTLMERMEEKGWLTHREHRRQFLYSAAIPRQTSIARKVLDVLNSACNGSPELLMSALLDHRGLSKDEYDRIEALLNASKKNSNQGKKR